MNLSCSSSAGAPCRPGLLSRIPQLADRHRAGEFADGVYAALYFVHWQIALHGGCFASRTRRSDTRPDADAWLRRLESTPGEALDAALLELLERHQFRGVIPNVTRALAAWLRCEWPLRLSEAIPSAGEVLRMQARGERPVTLIARHPRMLQPVLRRENAFTFMVHDLEHAYKFFHDGHSHAAQRAFFACIARRCDAGEFDAFLGDGDFAAKFDYLASDMNTHVMHSLQYLRAILIEHYARTERRRAGERLSEAAESRIASLLSGLAAETGWNAGAQRNDERL